MKNIIGIILLVFIFSFNLSAQTGPGGIGNATGTNGQPTNIIWLRADDLGLTNGAAVSAWADASGNGNDLGSSLNDPNDPIFVTNAINTTLPIVRFSTTTGTGTKLIKYPFNGFASDAVTTIVVYQSTDNTYGLVSYNTLTLDNNFLLFSNNNNFTTFVDAVNDASGQSLSNASFQIATHKWHNINSGEYSIFQDGSLLASRTVASGRTIANNGSLAIGNEQDNADGGYNAAQALTGDIAEIIMFSSYLNDAQRTIIENYLNIKYGIIISNDVFTGADVTYKYNITGVGQETDGNHMESSSAGFYVQADAGTLNNGEYIMFAHNNTTNAVSAADVPVGVAARWAKDWYIEKTGTQNATLIFDLPEGISGQYPQNISNYVLLFRNATTGSYSQVTATVNYGDADQVAFNVTDANLSNGYYTLGTTDAINSPVDGLPGTTWYTLVSGNWSDTLIWTLDPSGALPNNPNGLFPQLASDKVVIKSGKNITMDITGIHCSELTVDGRLDMGATSVDTFDIIKGNGRILMAADNFPSFTDMSDFNTAGQGEGTVVYYGATSYSLATPYTFFNMEVNMDAGQTITLLSDYTVNGYLRIDQGTLKINDNAATTNLNLTVQGDVTVQATGLISTGTANARHQFNFYGDFTNNGDVRFTSRTIADYANEATDGIVDANFLNGSKDQSILCNGTTNFYRIEIDKGTDDTYILDIQASAVANFNLFGYANENHGSIAQLATNANALGLLKGTVKIGSNVNIPTLSTASNYNISAAARLWVAGGTVQKNSGNSTVPYGVIEVSAGLLESNISSGITTRNNGLIRVSGGIINTNVIRTSIDGVSVGGYVQSGGTVNIINPNSATTTYYHFSMTYPGNTFSMTGGTLHVYDANGTNSNQGGIFIASSAANINVTGGTVIAEIASTTNPFKITSTAPFYNLILRNTNDAVTDHTLDAGTNINNTAVADLAAQPLVVLNDLTIEPNVMLKHNGKDISIGGSLSIDRNAQREGNNRGIFYNASVVNKLSFNGSGNASFYIGYNTGDAIGWEYYAHNFEINKDNATDTITISSDIEKDISGFENRILHVIDTISVRKGVINQGRQSVRLFGEVFVYKNGQMGIYEAGTTKLDAYFMLRDGDVTLKTEVGSIFGNIKLNTTGTVTLTTDVYMQRIGFHSGLMNLQTYNLRVDYLHRNATANNYPKGNGSTAEMIYSDANASDGGISLLITGNGTYCFPLGTRTTATRYTYAEIVVTNFSDPGYVQIRPVDGELKTTALGSGDLLDYYWRIGHTGFTTPPTVQYEFSYDLSDDINGTDNTFYPGKVLDESPYTRSYENDLTKVADGATPPTITFNDDGLGGTTGFTLEKANYTAGVAARFTGTVPVFHSNSSYVRWDDPAAWLENQVPTNGSIVYIRDGDRMRSGPTEPKTNIPAVTNLLGTGARVQFYDGGTFNLGEVRGTGWISFDMSVNPVVNGDFGDFSSNSTSLYLFYTTSDGSSYTINNIPQPAPSITFESGRYTLNQTNLIINYNLTSAWNNYDIIIANDVLVKGNLVLTNQNRGSLQFPASGNSVTLTVNGNVTAWDPIVVNNPGAASTLEHRFVVGGDITVNDDNIDLFNAANRPAVILELNGDTSAVYTNSAGTIPDFYRVILNKGANQDSTFTFNNSFTLSGATSGIGVSKALELQNGTLVLNDPAININLTTGDDDFSIPSTAALEVRQGTVNANGNSGILLDGKLLVSGGTVNMTGGDNYIQYSASGNATIEVTGGTLQVGSQIRRGTSSTEGILTYTQSGGTVEIGTDAAGSASRGIFEILNTGSSFTHSAGSFTLVNDYRSNPSTQSFYFNPATVNLSTGTGITFGNASTLAGSQNFTMYAGADLMNLTIDNTSGNSPKVTMNVLPLTLTENLNIGTGTELDANGWNINMHGNFNNSGIFTPNQNKVYFLSADAQEINGTTTFYDLYKTTSADTLKLATATDITVDNYLSLETGIFNDGGNDVNVKGNLYNAITALSSGSSNGIVLNGTVEQTITGSGTYARLTTDNPAGMIVPTGNTVTITDSLQMRSGIFSIGQNLIVLTNTADIIETSAFSESNMIQTNISFTDAGVEKYFPIISSATTFIYPMGSAGKYTPVKFDITANGNATGSIRIRAADERHPSVIEDSESPNPEIVDADNVLQYYWTIDATGITGFSSTATMDCYASDVLVTTPYTEADYITARLLDSTLGTWDKFPNVDFNESTYELYFYFTGTNDQGIDGDYTAGIDDAIPDQVPGYISFQNGNWSDVNTWQTYPALEGQGVNIPAGGPRGSIVYIKHTVTTPSNFVSAYITRLEATGILNVGTTFGHRLGFVSGTGRLYLERGDMPAGVYDDFFAPDSGTIEFGYTGVIDGSENYDILSEVLSVNNLTLTGSGDRIFPNLDLVIHGNLIMNGPDVKNTHNESVEVRKDITFTSGTFYAGFDDGADVNNGMFIIGGSITQNLNGPATFTGTNAFNHFKMSNPIGLVLSQPVDINHQLVFVNGPITTTATNILTLHDISETIVTGAGSGNYVDGPLLKNINTGGGFDFPLGNASRYGNVLISNTTTTGNQYWEAQYYNYNPGNDGYDPTVKNTVLQTVSNNEYWRIESAVATTALVALRWDSQSGMPTDAVNYTKTRIAEWQNTTPQWEEVDASNTFSGAGSTGTVSSTVASTFNEWVGTGNLFTLSTTYVSQAFTWDGSLSSAWNTLDNWNVNLVPTNLDDVTIPSGMPFDPIIAIDANCGAMDLQAGATLTVNSGASLALTGNLVMNGNITLKSDATGTGVLLDNGTIGGTGTATVERYLTANNYHYLSAPLAAIPNTTFYTILPGETAVNPNYYLYDETNTNADWLFGWTPVTSGNMTVGTGYAYYYTSNYTFNMSGGLFNTGNINYSITHSNNGIQSDGWNFIGNPYPSTIAADEFIDANSSVINGTLYFWDDDGSDGADYNTNDYATWNLAGAIGTGSGSSSTNGTKVPDGFIGVSQGFFVRKTNAGTDPVTFTNSMRKIGNGQFFKAQKTDNIWRLKLSVSSLAKKLYNETLIAFVDGASDEFDNLYDGVKLKGSSEISFYSMLRDEDYAIQSFSPIEANEEKSVSLGLMLNQSGEYVISIQQFENFNPNVNIYLKDKLLDQTINLREVSTYTFNSTAGTDENRFEIYFNYIEENEGFVNHRPVLANSIPDNQATEDMNFNMTISENTFNDVDINDKLTYTASLSGGANLPAWLSFNNKTRTFSGFPENSDVTTLSVELTATDESNESVYDVFVLNVVNVNDAPELLNKIPDQKVDEGANYAYTVPANTFNDIDLGDALQLSAKLSDGSSLPNWLIFNTETLQLSGTAKNSGDIDITITATDKAGASASDKFTLSVKSTTSINSLSASEIIIYPNPTQGEFFVKTDYYSDDLLIIVRDFSGKTIKELKPTSKRTQISISEFATGMYFIELTDKEESKVFKINLNK